MIGCLLTHVHKQPIIALYFEFETVLKFYNLEAWFSLEVSLSNEMHKKCFSFKYEHVGNAKLIKHMVFLS